MTTQTMTVQVTRSFAVGAERIFDAWLDPAIARRFLFATATGKIVRAEIDARVGGAFLFVDRRDGEDVEHLGTYLEIDRPRRLAFTFVVPKFSPVESRVAIDISPTEGGCELTLTHDGVFLEWADRAKGGWDAILTTLAGAIDPAITAPRPFARLIAPDTIVIERVLPGPIERVWQYLVDSEKRGTWLGTGEMTTMAGETFSLYLRNSDLSTVDEPTPPEYVKHDAGYTTTCLVTQCDPPTTLAFVWDKTTEIAITLTPAGDNVTLRLAHRQLSGSTPLSGYGAAWHTHLDFLADHLTGRDPGSFWQAFAKNEAAYEQRRADYE